jgi:hypothetical protein
MRHEPSFPLTFIAGGALVVLLEVAALASWQGWLPRKPAPPVRHARPLPPVEIAAEPPASIATPDPDERPVIDAYYRELRAQIRWVPARIGREVLLTVDPASRLLLAKSAARRARLDELGLGFEDVYGIIAAESSWTPRDGASRDGTPNLGIAQFEPATAAALGVRDPHDAVEAVHAAAEHMREAAAWSASRIARLKLSRKERAARLREGISIYYNLSSRGREAWDGRDASRLPAATNAHIRNAREGAKEAALFEAQSRVLEAAARRDRAVLAVTATAAATAEP